MPSTSASNVPQQPPAEGAATIAYWAAALAGVLAAIWVGWFVLGRVEWATILAGLTFALVAGCAIWFERKRSATDVHWGLIASAGASVATAGVFDLWDFHPIPGIGDWDTGFLLAALVLFPRPLRHLYVDWRLAQVANANKAAEEPEETLLSRIKEDESFASNLVFWGACIALFFSSLEDGAPSTTDLLAYACIGIVSGCIAIAFIRFVARQPWNTREFISGVTNIVMLAAIWVSFRISIVTPYILIIFTVWVVLEEIIRAPRTPGEPLGRLIDPKALAPTVAGSTISVLLVLATIATVVSSRLDISVTRMVTFLPVPEATFARLAMQDQYVFAHGSAPAGSGKLKDPAAIIASMRNPLDRWSGASPEEAISHILRGELRLGIHWSQAGDKWQVAYVHPDSPAKTKGIRRGWQLVQWNSPPPVSQKEDVLFSDPSGRRHLVDFPKDWKRFPALWHKIVTAGDRKIGYFFVFDFTRSDANELRSTFSDLKRAGIQELVVDLRYNSGGELEAATHLASLIAGARHEGEIFVRVRYNDRYLDANEESNLRREKESLDISRLFVLTTKTTCSASEALINGLKPYMEVITIGSGTCGKPVGYSSMAYRGTVYDVMSMRVENANDQTDYFQGLQAVCAAEDDLSQELGSPEEELFRQAIEFMARGTCAPRFPTTEIARKY